MTRKNDEWECSECNDTYGRHDQWFEGLCGDCHETKQNLEKKDAIERMLISMWANIGINIPSNHEDIIQFCFEDVDETADPTNWDSGDVAIAFRGWIEAQGKN